MKKASTIILACLLASTAGAGNFDSPSGNLTLTVNADRQQCGAVTMTLATRSATLMDGITLGLNTTKRQYEQLRLISEGTVHRNRTDYHMLQGKRRHCVSHSSDCRYTFVNAQNDTLLLDLRLSDDGLSFRYTIPGGAEGETVTTEATSYPIATGAPRWIATYDIGYEQYYPQATKAEGGRWGYPALVEPAKGQFVLITESDIQRHHCASWLDNTADAEHYSVVPASNDQSCGGTWTSPWRVLIAGGLNTIVESTLVTDVASPAVTDRTDWIKPGVVSWVYWAHNHGSKDFQIVKQYIDMAVELNLPYVLIDWEWEVMGNGGKLEDAVAYARQKGIKTLLWYNSWTGWTNGAPGTDVLTTKESRCREFERISKLGLSGVKVDFFAGDKVETMDYCIDILEDAAQYNLLVNFHGATIPRGWQRTYPNFMSAEAVLGAEWYNNNGVLTNRAAAHNATLPFTRNVVGPMDYTPCAFSDSQNPHLTSNGHELALTVLFESSLQHLADRPESFLAQPETVKKFLGQLPSVWDETRLLDGYPAHHVVMARRSGDKWYVAGINGTDEPLTLTADLNRLTLFETQVTLFADGGKQNEWNITHTAVQPSGSTLEVKCLPRGGFVAVVEGLDPMTVYNPWGDALVPDMIADASIELIGDWFYCYATTDGYGRHLDTSGPPVIWKSQDFVHWQMDGCYFPSAQGQKYWAPSKAVKAHDGKWYIYATINGYMYPAVADSPDGPFRLARGEDVFRMPYTKGATLLQTDEPGGIDTEVFIDDDGQAYVFWGRFYAGKLNKDMVTVTDVRVLDTPHHVYSEGPGFFKRNGIYYYYYTLGGDERYQYAYMMSRVSPFGPWEVPEQDIITTTDHETGVFGPGHGGIFNVGDDYYFAYLEFGRRSTNRQTFVNKMEFNPDGTIRPVKVDLKGVGALRNVKRPEPLKIDSIWATSVRRPMQVAHNQDIKCQRTECFAPQLAIDGSNGSRWMAEWNDCTPQLTIDLGCVRKVKQSELYMVRPTAGHTYRLECSIDGQHWQPCGGQTEPKIKAPCTDNINKKARYLRVTILTGELGVWEWNVY